MLAKDKTETKGQTLLGKEASANPILSCFGRRSAPLGPSTTGGAIYSATLYFVGKQTLNWAGSCPTCSMMRLV